jgi:hypothetical protein
MVTALGYKIFLMFATINILGMGTFSLRVSSVLYKLSTYSLHSLIPETKGRSLEDMDVIFGSISAEQRRSDIAKATKGLEHETAAHAKNANETESRRSDSVGDKV